MATLIRGIVNAVLSHFFQNLPKKSYVFDCNEVTSKYEIRLLSSNQFMHSQQYSNYFDAFFTPSKSGNNLACLMIKPNEQSKYTILFSHGGTVDLGNLCNFLFTLSKRLCCNILVYDYSGFGESPGTPTEKAVYADSEAAFGVLLEKYCIPVEQIILYGQSLGTAPSLHLASQYEVKAVVLHSPFLSIAKLYLPKMHNGQCRFYDFFKNAEMIDKVKAPTLILHGTKDAVVPISHSKELLARCQNALSPLWVENGGHDDLFAFDGYLKRLKRLVDYDLAAI